jgi:hypothetical protein
MSLVGTYHAVASARRPPYHTRQARGGPRQALDHRWMEDPPPAPGQARTSGEISELARRQHRLGRLRGPGVARDTMPRQRQSLVKSHHVNLTTAVSPGLC